MKMILVLAAAWLPLAVLRAEPMVPAFDRFHAASPDAAGGRLLYHELGCVNCHGGDTGLPPRRGPSLAGVTTRAQPAWLRSFLRNPAAARPGTTMPHLLPDTDPQSAEAVLQYLATLGKPVGRPKAMRVVNAERGRDLFHTLGCVACHAPDPAFVPPSGRPAPADLTHPSVALPDLARKHSLGSLAEFLRDPLKTRPDGRMPRFALEEEDVADLASYLTSFAGGDGITAPGLEPLGVDRSLAARGREWVAKARCAACHDLPAEVAVKPVTLTRGTGGCLAEEPAPGLPRFGLSGAQRAALGRFLAERTTRRPAAAETVELTLHALNCAACHERDTRGGPDAGRRVYFQGDDNLGEA